jgi:hypothetical protein
MSELAGLCAATFAKCALKSFSFGWLWETGQLAKKGKKVEVLLPGLGIVQVPSGGPVKVVHEIETVDQKNPAKNTVNLVGTDCFHLTPVERH